MKEECHDDKGIIIKDFSECEKCERYPCRELSRAMDAIINGEN